MYLTSSQMRTMKTYINAEELQKITGLKKRTCLKIINEVREEMKTKGYFMPMEKTKYAVRDLVMKKIGG